MGPNPLRGDIIAALGEFVGMTMFIFLALSGVQAALNAPYGPAEKVPADAGPTFRYELPTKRHTLSASKL